MSNSSLAAIQRSFWPVIVPALIAAAFPAFVLLTNPRIPFANDFHCDPWHYFGFFYLVDQPQTLDVASRMLSRISEVWLGRLANDLAPGAIADYVNFIILYSGASLALYFAVLRFFDGMRAVIATAFFAFNTIFVGTLAVTYTGPSVLYNMLGIWLAAEAQRNDAIKRTLALLAMGLVLGVSVHGHAYAVECAFAIPLYAIRPRQVAPLALFRQLVEIGLKTAAGIVIATLLIGAVNWGLFGGKFLFFASQVESVVRINTADYQITGWFFKACRGAVFLLAVALPLLAIGAAVHRTDDAGATRQIWLVNVVTLVIAAALFADDALGGFFMQYDYYYVMLLPHIAISLASLYAREQLSRRWLGALVVVYVAIAAMSELPSVETIGRFVASPDNGFFSVGVAMLAIVAFAASIFATTNRARAAFLALALVVVGCWGFSARPQRMGRLAWEDAARAQKRYGADSYTRVRAAMQFLSSHRFTSRPVFWVSIDNGHEETIGIARSFDYCVVQMNLPTLDMSEGIFERDFKVGNTIVLVHPNPNLVELANASLKAHGLAVVVGDRTTVTYKGVSYSVVLGTLAALASNS
jgi:hypothetical protein